MKPNAKQSKELAPPLQLAGSRRWKAPAHLELPTRKWFDSVMATFELEEHDIKRLIATAEAWDRLQGARKAIAASGMVYLDRFGQPHARPEVKIEETAKDRLLPGRPGAAARRERSRRLAATGSERAEPLRCPARDASRSWRTASSDGTI